MLVERLQARLQHNIDEFVKLSHELEVFYAKAGLDGGGIAILAPDYRWGARSAEQTARQMTILRAHATLSELLEVLLAGAPGHLERQRANADQELRKWLEFSSNWSLTQNKHQNAAAIRSAGSAVASVIEVLASSQVRHTIAVPDTNAILNFPDPVEYRARLGVDSFEFLMLPTVLGELDKLKVEHRNEQVREKAKSAIRRVKGWRGQGPLTEGVTVDGTITVRAEHREPKMADTLSWLDKQNADDRIIASILSVQREFSSARVVLLTGDINLQNKADAAMIEIVDI